MSELKLPTGANPILDAFRTVTKMQNLRSEELTVDPNSELFCNPNTPQLNQGLRFQEYSMRAIPSSALTEKG